MNVILVRNILKIVAPSLVVAFSAVSCSVPTSANRDSLHVMEVSVPQQKMALYREGSLMKTYPISTSKFGLGDEKGSYRTPPGKMEVAEKIGEGKPAGAVFKSRQWTGEVVKPNAPGRDPIVSRILWLNGLEPKNQNAYSRCIYIHGTAAEKDIGKAASYGCIRMKSKDVIDLYEKVGSGAEVVVMRKSLWRDFKNAEQQAAPIQAVPLAQASVPMVFQGVEPTATKPVWNQLNPAQTGYDVLEDAGYNRDYLLLEDPVQLGLD